MAKSRAASAKDVSDLAVAVARLDERVKELATQFTRERDGASEHRRGLRDVISAQSSSMQALAKEVGEMKPLVSDFREKRAEARGAAKLLKVFYLLCGGAAGSAGALIVEYFKTR